MHVGLKLPNWGPAANGPAILRTAAAAEARGFGSLWVSDHIAVLESGLGLQPGTAFLDPFVALSLAAAVTDRVLLGTGVLILPLRHPVAVAKQAASVHALSGGRLVLGVGAGWQEREFDLLGQDFRSRGPRTDEAIDVLRACWTGDEVTLPGNLAAHGRVQLRPAATGLPVFVGGHSRAALRRTVARGDGWYASGIDPAEFGRGVGWLRGETARPLRYGVRPAPTPSSRAADTVAAYAAAGADFVVLDGVAEWSCAEDAEDWVHRTADALDLGTDRVTAS
jgi:probable F420-dependent oxidoreductase